VKSTGIMPASAMASRLQVDLRSLESQLDWQPGNPGTLGLGQCELATNLCSLLRGRMPGRQANFGLSWGCKLTATEMEAKIKLKPELPRLPCSWLKQDPKSHPSPWHLDCLCRGVCSGTVGCLAETSQQCHCSPPGPGESTSGLTDL